MSALPEPSPTKKFLSCHLHRDHAEILGIGGGEREFFEAAVARGIERHLHAVEVVALDGGGHDFAVGVAGHAGKPRHFLFASFHQAFERAVGGLDFREVVGLAEAVDVDEIDVIGLQALEAGFEAAQKCVARAVGNFRGEPDIFAARRHDAADAGFALAVSVGIGGVEIGDAEIDGAIEDGGAVFVLIHKEAAAAAEGEDGNFGAGSSEGAGGRARRTAGRC